jgi:uncharacterized protein YndB with AHSA1/START domain
MTSVIETAVATQTHQVYIRATADEIWNAVTDGDVVERYGYRSRVEYDLRPGGSFRALANEAMLAYGHSETIIDGEVLEVEPGRRLVQTWNPLFDGGAIGEEPATRLTYEIEPAAGGTTKLTLTHELDGAPQTAAVVGGTMPGTGGGWPFVLSDLKSLLETGSALDVELA